MTLHTIPYSLWALGAPLYMPAHRHDILDCANGEKYPSLRSMIFCTEDAVSHSEVDSSLRHLGLCLQGFRAVPERFRFIRVRNPEVLARLLDLPHIDKIDGFVLPKFDTSVFHAYFDQLKGTNFKIMPTLETRHVFDVGAMVELRQALLQDEVFAQILMLRIGGNDLLNLLGIRRPRQLTLYDTPLSHIISQLVTVFNPYHFSLSAPVFEYLNDNDTLQKEIQRDLAFGLIGKTAIHPSQIANIEAVYQVQLDDYEMAVKLIDSTAPAVFKMHDAMCEVATHRQWAISILNRQQFYGVSGEKSLELTDVSV
ncbi:MAG: ATP-binding protein [Methylococcales bacterium]|nr:ATP-binding protein [Methylococcales bacterium]